MTPEKAYRDLADRVEGLKASDNNIDVQVEVALFEPDQAVTGIRANAAGTKVIYTCVNGSEDTHWADDWTMDHRRARTAAALRAHAARIGRVG